MNHYRRTSTGLVGGPSKGLRVAAVLAVGAGLGLTACSGSSSKSGASGSGSGSSSGSSSNPTQAVNSSFSSLGSASSIGLKLSIGLTQAQVQQLASQGHGKMTPAEANAISTGSFFFDYQTGHGEALDSSQAATDSQNSLDLGLQIGTDKPLELRYVGQNLYVRTEVETLVSDVGQNPKQVQSFLTNLNQINSIVPGASALGQGQWVEVSHDSLTQLESLLNQFAGQSGGGSSSQNTSQMRQAFLKLRASAAQALKANTTYKSLGSSGGRNEYQATLQVHDFLAALGPALQSDLGNIPAMGSKFNSDYSHLEANVPAGQTAVADLFVSGGKLSEVDIDADQFASGSQKAPFPVPLRLEFTTPPAISPPVGATQVDLSKLPQLLQGLSQNSGGGA